MLCCMSRRKASLVLDKTAPNGPVRWRSLPHDFPHWMTVYSYYRTWCSEGLWEATNAALVQKERILEGRDPQPSAGAMDSQSVKTTVLGKAAPPGPARQKGGLNAVMTEGSRSKVENASYGPTPADVSSSVTSARQTPESGRGAEHCSEGSKLAGSN
jgi:hypothetical protein